MPESVQETVRAHLDHGRACLDKGKYDDAIADYTKAIGLDPNVALAYTNRGLAYERKNALGRAYERKNALGRAIADYTKAIALDPNDANVYTNRGVAYGKKGEVGRAIADFRKALEINPFDQVAKEVLKGLGVTP